jgi:hypothetical protein
MPALSVAETYPLYHPFVPVHLRYSVRRKGRIGELSGVADWSGSALDVITA